MHQDPVPVLEVLYETEKWEEIIEKVREFKPIPETLYYKALALQQLKDFEGAISLYKKIHSYVTSLREIDYNIGLCYYHMGDLEKCVYYFKRYILINPRHHSIYFHLVKVLEKLQDYPEIVKMCEEATKYKAKVPIKVWAIALNQTRNYAKSHQKTVLYLKRKPDNPKMWEMLGDILNSCGYYREALIAYDTALEHDGQNDGVRFKLESVVEANQTTPVRLRIPPLYNLEDPILPAITKKLTPSRACGNCVLF